ncbi:hypothetical protein TELCIR_14099 [Teladorsagia circumcincta]|uniref:Protein kinase domain-containing protein n=1 Tax=Teladorsagia circumcincta TaxID=45464 RepID=A0A2G9U1Y7_TELCI|nr:hypothetical protein TELCIR_14099 [Teladorsagia circumcincta]
MDHARNPHDNISILIIGVCHMEYKRLYSGGVRRGGRRGVTSRPRVMPARNESLRDDRCGSVVPDELARNLPAELDERFTVLRLLGDGNTALVYEVMDRRTQEHGALKVIARDSAVGKIALIESELAIMKRIEHPFIVQMFDNWTIDGAYYLSLELVELYTAPHGEFELKLADFGLATELPEDGGKLTVICGTPTYVASEVILETGVSLPLTSFIFSSPIFASIDDVFSSNYNFFLQLR